MHVESQLKEDIRAWGRELGFSAIGFAAIDGERGSEREAGLAAWLAAGCHGEMDYMAAHGPEGLGGSGLRARPDRLLPGARSVITARMDYRVDAAETGAVLSDPERAFVSRYALGRDYHKLLRRRLQKLTDRIVSAQGTFGYRVFTDSAPVMEVEWARQGALGWRGKHTLLLNREAGSYFFLGGIVTELALASDRDGLPVTDHCGTCTACIDACPTGAIVAPYRLDARRCISYLTIEHKSDIPEAMRAPLGNRIYGCDDCQTACPWNRFAPLSVEADFAPRNGLDAARLVELFAWTEDEFNERLAGSPIRRIGHARWLRNIALALGNSGNALNRFARVAALRSRADHPSPLVRDAVAWARDRLGDGEDDPGVTATTIRE